MEDTKGINEIVNRILDEDKEIRNSETGTNGELSIEQFIEKHPEINQKLDQGEIIKYIAYEKIKSCKW